MVLWKLETHMQKNKGRCLFALYAKNNSIWIKVLNIQLEAIKLLNENFGENLHDIGPASELLDITPTAQLTKWTNRTTYIKLKSVCTAKDMRMERQPTECKKIFANFMSDKN